MWTLAIPLQRIGFALRARRVGKHKTKKDAVTVALQEYIKLQRRRGILDLEGQVDFWPGYDHKELRARRPKT